MPSTERKKIGKYDVIDVIGRGGMGIVYKALDPGIGRTVAIKMTTAAVIADPEMLQRFNREVQSVGNLQHPNIVTVYDLGVEDGNPYLVMELLDGESLDSIVRSRRPFSFEEKLDVVVQVCNGIQYAHEHKVIHRDIKPGNIMILKDGVAKIVDFGIAQTGMQRLTRPGQLVGSFQYMSPEQINAANVDSRTDIFSIGVMLFELITGKLPFEGKDTGDMLMKILHEPAPSITGFVKTCPPGLDEIVQHALAKNADQRYQTAEELSLDLGHVLERWRRDRISEYLQGAETAAAQRQWTRAKEQLLQVLKRDRQNSRANVRLREVQLEIQKQQRSERAKELQAQAEHALAQSDVAGALAYLNEAVELDKSNLEIAQLRDSLQENRARSETLRDLMQRAEFAQDAGDLEGAQRAVEEGLALDPTNTDFRSMQVVINRELVGRDKQKRVQEFLGEARKQISSRRFTGALEVLRKAESLDPSATAVQELITLASTGQQQEKRRQELERLTAQIEDALVKEDYATASARIEEGLKSYPDDRGLLKLQAVVKKTHEDTEKSRFIEEKTAEARRLLDGGQGAEAGSILKKALEKYPGEPTLEAMLTLVQQNVERTRKEQEKTEVIQSAREAIRRKAYPIAISILEAARKKSASSEYDELLQFAQNEAENQTKRRKIDAVAEEARHLISEDRYSDAITLLKATLEEIPDQELQIVLADAERHLEELTSGMEKAIATAERLMRQERFADAINLLERQSAQFGKVPRFREALENSRERLRMVQLLSVLKEEVRDALSKSDIARARQLCQDFRESDNSSDVALIEKEIDAKRAELANNQLEMALRDARLLVTVQSSDAALSVLESVASVVPLASLELQRKFEMLRTAARNAASTPKAAPAAAEPAPEKQTIVASAQETQIADPDALQSMLVEVAQIAGNYREDRKVQSAIYNLKQQLTERISFLRESSSQLKKSKPVEDQKASTPTATASTPQSAEIVFPSPHIEPPSAPTVATPLTQQSVQVPTQISAAGAPPKPPAGEKAPAETVEPRSTPDDRHEQAIKEGVSKARKLLSAGSLPEAFACVNELLVIDPNEPQLLEMRSLLEQEAERQRLQARRNDLDELRRLEVDSVGLADQAAVQSLAARARLIASKYLGDLEVMSASERVLQKLNTASSPAPQEAEEQAEIGRPVAPEPAAAKPTSVSVPPTEKSRTQVKPAAAPPVEPRVPLAPARAVVTRGAPAPSASARAIHPMHWLRGTVGKIALGAVLLVLMVATIWRFTNKHPAPTQTLPVGKALAIRIHTSPTGATIRVNKDVRGISDLELQLPEGSYEIEAELTGYRAVKASLDAKAGSPNSLDLTLQPALPTVKLSSDTGIGKVTLDDMPVVDLAGEERSLEGIAAGNHKLKFEGPQGNASFAFSTAMGTPPAVVGPISASRVVAIVVGNLGPKVHVYSSAINADVNLDDGGPAKVGADGLELTNVSSGTHQLTIKESGDQYKMAFEVGPLPTLSTFLQSGKNIGTLLVTTREDGVKVTVNGTPLRAATRDGQLRVSNLDPKEYVIEVSKPGFQPVSSQKVTIRKGEVSTVVFSLIPIPKVATLTIRGGTPGSLVFLDDKPAGLLMPDGSLNLGSITPGDHSVVLRKERFEPKRLQKQFIAGADTLIASPESVLQPLTGMVKITFSPSDAQVTIGKSGETPTKVANGTTLKLNPGSYTIVARTADEMTRTKVIEVSGGQYQAIDLPLAPMGMSKWDDPAAWKQEQNEYIHRGGGFVLFGVTPTTGTFTFSVELQKGKRLEWFLNYTAPGEYVLFQMDENFFYRSIFHNGQEMEQAKIPHKIQKKAFETMRIRVTPNEIVHQIRDGDSWFVLDRFTAPGTNLASGRFGFLIPGKDQVALANFSHYPDLEAH